MAWNPKPQLPLSQLLVLISRLRVFGLSIGLGLQVACDSAFSTLQNKPFPWWNNNAINYLFPQLTKNVSNEEENEEQMKVQ